VLIALALVLLMASTVAPFRNALAILIPVLAALMLAAWRNGGSAWTAAAWTGLAIWAVVQAPGGLGGLGAIETGYGLLVAVAFGTAAIALPSWSFFNRALASVAVALGVATVVGAAAGVTSSRVATLIRAQFAETALLSGQTFVQFAQQQLKDAPKTAETAATMEQARQFADAWAQMLPSAMAVASPALVALETLAVLGLAWALFHRLSRTRIGPPLGRLAEFRFPDALVWGIVAGLAVIVVPGLAPLRGVAANLLIFFGALFALRGVAVLWFFASPGPVLTVVAVLAGVILGQIVIPTAACLGLSDIWIDWRRRASAPTTP
jgi:hypothetical protein